ncbi:hypothetical protein [Chlorobaculum limnaeum]|uniref:hypothetical protein n=1 Tax=Chlorobaculum limnaeum TaxID=274537 RepID=UPI0012EDDA0E|nr:hypothetical protein [Chlorobaculum limnaeum]
MAGKTPQGEKRDGLPMSWFSGFIGSCKREDSENNSASNRMDFLLYFVVYIAFDHDTVKQAEGSKSSAKRPNQARYWRLRSRNCCVRASGVVLPVNSMASHAA